MEGSSSAPAERLEMSMDEYTLRYLEKDEFDAYAPKLFALMRANMSHVAPSQNSYGQDYVFWYRTYGGAFQNRMERKIVLAETLFGDLVGFFGYCEDGDTFLMEEIQFAPAWQETRGLFRALYAFVLDSLSCEIAFTEAYAHKSNKRSLGILKLLGLSVIGENEARDCFHLRGDMNALRAWFLRDTISKQGDKMEIRIATKPDMEAVFALRVEVFVDEQGVPPTLELDEEDAHALHVIATENGATVGCARVILSEGEAHIGRLAVKRAHRGEGIGTAICRFIIDYCRQMGNHYIWLNSQSHAVPFYERLGFCPQGEVFMEAGIEHMKMVIADR